MNLIRRLVLNRECRLEVEFTGLSTDEVTIKPFSSYTAPKLKHEAPLLLTKGVNRRHNDTEAA